MATATIPSEIRIFATIAEQGSFVSAARRLRIPKTTISRKIAELEARLGVGLFERTTRKLALTEAGQVFYGHCAGILVSIENAETAIGQLTQTPRGTVRLTAPFSFAAFSLAPVLPEFIARFPEVRIDLQVRSDMVDLILDNIDVALRWGSLGDSSHISRSLCAVSSVLVASPGYLALAGTPASVAGLTRHRTLGMTQHTQTGETQGWDLVRAPASDGGRAGAKSTHGAAIPGESVNLRPVLTANAA